MADDNVRKIIETGEVIDDDQEIPEPDSDLNIQDGDYPIDSDDDSEGETDGPGGEEESGEDTGTTGPTGSDGEGEGDNEGNGEGTGTGSTGGTGGTGSSSLPKVGQKVITSDGRSGVIKVVYPNGDIEI